MPMKSQKHAPAGSRRLALLSWDVLFSRALDRDNPPYRARLVVS